MNITISTPHAVSTIAIGASHLSLRDYIPHGRKIIIITDSNMRRLYPDFLRPFDIIEIGLGESIKTLATIEYIYQKLISLDADRYTFIVAFGGGIVCDIAGFAAATFMRGINFGFVASTLLSQVDASVGGKNGVNLGGLKNMIGTFAQPQFVICDPALLKTLPPRQFTAGLAEIIKAAAIRSKDLFDYIEQHAADITSNDEVLQHLIAESIKIKADIVQHDEREQGARRLLNFGHTFGHAIELQTSLLHGEAVAIGMCIAAQFSEMPESDKNRLTQLIKSVGLPTKCPIAHDKMLSVIAHDKKRHGDSIHIVGLRNIGHAEYTLMRIADIQARLQSLF